MADKKKTTIPPSLQPRKRTRKAIPVSSPPPTAPVVTPPPKTPVAAPKPAKKATPPPVKEQKVKKERFTLWLPEEVYAAFKVHVATRKGSGSDYIEQLIKKDLKIK